MKNKLVFLVLFQLVCLCYMGHSQTDSFRQVSIRGRVLDSLANSAVSEATVTLYHKDRQKILKYGFTNNRGMFDFAAVPSVDSVFLLEISHVGFVTVTRTVSLKEGIRSIDVGTVPIAKQSILIEEVDVGRPPIMMHKDTLVIHPEAFALQPNAVVEDLLMKVPGIVVWGDGEITVNGKKVEQVLVDGKRFFGGDAVTATRNLPSGAVDKVKVYEQPQQRADEETKLEMDIRLKKPNGLFGKIQGGIGSQDRGEGILLLNYFDRKNQISVFGGRNNTNKQVRSLNEVLMSNVYKAGGEDINVYAPAFGRAGLNRFLVGGGKIERVWNTRVKNTINLLYTSDDTELHSDLMEFRYFEDRSDQKIEQTSNQDRHLDRLTLGGNVTYKDKHRQLQIASRITQTKLENRQHRDRNVWDENDDLLSALTTDDRISSAQASGEFKVEYKTKYKEGLFKDTERFNLTYQLHTSDQEEKKQQMSSFVDTVQGVSESVDRLKEQQQQRNQHDLFAHVDLQSALYKMGVLNWDLMLNNNIKWVDIDADQRDRRPDPLTGSYTLLNESLTYRDRFNELEWTPGLSFGKAKMKYIARGSDMRGFKGAIDLATTRRTNRSDHSLRGLDQHTFRLVPSGSIYYRQNRQLWTSSWALGLETIIQQPSLEQLVAVMDETQKDYNRLGNPDLQPEEQYRFGFAYSRRSSINSSRHDLKLHYTLVSHQMVDSSFFLEDGERISYVVNAGGRPFYDADYRYKSAPKLGNIPLNLLFTANLRKGANYYFNNGVRYSNDNMTSFVEGKVTGTFYDHFLLGLRGTSRKLLNTSNGNTRNSGMNSLGMDVTVTWPRRTTFISSITGTNSYIKDVSSDYQYFWNVHVYYRMLKKEQLEIKVSVYDILNNSKNIRTYADNNIVRREQTNNLRQYVMLSLSYYPRFF